MMPTPAAAELFYDEAQKLLMVEEHSLEWPICYPKSGCTLYENEVVRFEPAVNKGWVIDPGHRKGVYLDFDLSDGVVKIYVDGTGMLSFDKEAYETFLASAEEDTIFLRWMRRNIETTGSVFRLFYQIYADHCA